LHNIASQRLQHCIRYASWPLRRHSRQLTHCCIAALRPFNKQYAEIRQADYALAVITPAISPGQPAAFIVITPLRIEKIDDYPPLPLINSHAVHTHEKVNIDE